MVDYVVLRCFVVSANVMALWLVVGFVPVGLSTLSWLFSRWDYFTTSPPPKSYEAILYPPVTIYRDTSRGRRVTLNATYLDIRVHSYLV